jgi:hypothetical protein
MKIHTFPQLGRRCRDAQISAKTSKAMFFACPTFAVPSRNIVTFREDFL